MENMDGSVKYSKVDLKAACPTNRPWQRFAIDYDFYNTSRTI
jgi:hypothetical protein